MKTQRYSGHEFCVPEVEFVFISLNIFHDMQGKFSRNPSANMLQLRRGNGIGPYLYILAFFRYDFHIFGPMNNAHKEH